MKKTITWISVTEALPDDNIFVLIYDTSDVIEFAYHEDAGWLWLDADEYRGTVTHWAHLPEGPTP